MEYQTITNLYGNILDKVPRFITKKWIEVHDQSGTVKGRYKPSKQVRFNSSVLRSDLCDYSDACIVVEGGITVEEANDTDEQNRDLVLKNNAPFISCISKINNMLIDNAEYLDIVMPMYNLIESRKTCSKTSGTLLNYYKDISTDLMTDLNLLNKRQVLQEIQLMMEMQSLLNSLFH